MTGIDLVPKDEADIWREFAMSGKINNIERAFDHLHERLINFAFNVDEHQVWYLHAETDNF